VRPSTRARLRAPLALAGVLIAALAGASGARANAYNAVRAVYEARGLVPACWFASTELEAALREAGPDDAEYYGDLIQAIQGTLEAQGTGRCRNGEPVAGATGGTGAGGGSGGGGTGAGGETGGAGAPPAATPPAGLTAATGAGVPLPLIVLFALAAAFGAVALVAATARARGWRPGWAAAARHSWDEAEYRLAGAWADLADRVRPRRTTRRRATRRRATRRR
jgi:hypothetical protein